MLYIKNEVFTLDFEKLPEEKFYVAGFEGTEALNLLFHFEINVICANADIDTSVLKGSKATFIIHREQGEDAVFKGYISQIEQSGRVRGYSYYTVQLSPSFEKLKYVVNSMVFLDNDLKQTIEAVINHERFSPVDYEFRFSDTYPKKEFALQYNESIFNYILYRLEDEGAYFYSDRADDRVIFSDNPRMHDSSQGTVYYSPTTGLELNVIDEVINSFKLKQKMLPTRVIVRNYDWKDPSNIIVGNAEVDQNGFGDVYLINENVASREEANRIARIRAEQLLAESRIFTGSGSVPFFRPGVVFTLARHFSDSFNRDYIVTKIKHEGRQETLLTLIAGIPIPTDQEHLFYRNTFECIESDRKYRSPKTVIRTHIAGAIHAFIDGDKVGEPVMDKYGRYKVKLPFDVSGRSGGKASHWVRRAQEQVGKDFGVSFSLIPGTEVLITFINGDPDQPIINRALPNGETGSISGGGNKDFSGIRTSGGAQLTMENEHNTVALSNTTGSNIVFGAGSLDYLGTKTHHGFKSCSVGFSEAAGAMADYLSSFISRRRAICGPSSQYLAVLLKAAAKSGQYVYDSLSGKSADPDEAKLDFSALSTKLISLIPFVNPAPYNLRLAVSQDNTSSRLQCFPSLTELTVTVILMLFARGASATLEGVDDNEVQYRKDSSELTASDTNDDSSDKLNEVKAKIQRNKLIAGLAEFLPELGAMSAAIYMYKKLSCNRIGGIMIDAKDKNINLHAKTYISVNAERGIYLNTLHDTLFDETPVWGAPYEDMIGTNPNFTKMFDGVSDEKIKDFKERGSIIKKIPALHRNIMEGEGIMHNAYNSSTWGNGVKEEPPAESIGNRLKYYTFIVGNTVLYHMQSDMSYQIANEHWLCHADKFELLSTDSKPNDTTASNFVLYDTIGLDIPDEIQFGIQQGENDNDHAFFGYASSSQYFIAGIGAKAEKHWLLMTPDSIELDMTANHGVLQSGFEVHPNRIQLALVNKKRISFLNITDSSVKLYSKQVIIGANLLSDDTLYSSKSKNIVLGNKELVVRDVERLASSFDLKKITEESRKKIEEKVKKDKKEAEEVIVPKDKEQSKKNAGINQNINSEDEPINPNNEQK